MPATRSRTTTSRDGVRVLGGEVLRVGVERDVAPVGGDRRVEAGALRAGDAGVRERAGHELGLVRAHDADEHVGVRLPSLSSVDRFVARVANATTFPSADIRGTNAPVVRQVAAGAARPADQHVRAGLQIAAVDEALGLRGRDQVRGLRVPRDVAAVGRDHRVARLAVAGRVADALADQRRRVRLRVAEVDLLRPVRLRQPGVVRAEHRAAPVRREVDDVDAGRVGPAGRLRDEHRLARIERERGHREEHQSHRDDQRDPSQARDTNRCARFVGRVPRMSGPRFGLTGLAVMGANLARNVAHHDIPIAVHNRTASKTEQFMSEHGSEGPITGTGTTQEFVQALERPRTIMTMVKAGPGGRRRDRGARAAARRGRHDRRRRQLALQGHPAPRQGDERARPALPRRRRLRRRGGRAEGAEHHARRLARVLRRRRAHLHRDRRPGRRHAVLHLRRRRRRGPLREDGPQRHRVRGHPADRRGLRPAAPRRRARGAGDRAGLPRVERGRPRLVPDRDHGDRARQDRRAHRASRSST